MARKSRKQTAAPMPAPSLYVHVALYIRLSVEDNKKRGCSVENQKLVLNDFLSDKPDFVVYDTYIDNGATGTNFHRPGFQQMLSDIEAGHINCVIVKDLSRLGRNSIDTGYYIEQYFHAHNVRFIAVTDQFDTADSGNLHGGIMLPLKNMINEAYALDIGRKIKAQARQAMKDGDHAMSLRNGAWFYCRHSEVAETLPCHGVRIKMADLEQVVFETIRAQMCPALGIDSNKDKLDLQTVQQTEHEEKLRSIQDSKRYLYEQYALGEIDLETYRTRKAVYDTELVQAKNVHAVITAQTKQIKSDYEIKLKQQEIVQKVGNANMLTKALIDRLINKVYVFPGDRIEIEYATQDFLETKESEKEV